MVGERSRFKGNAKKNNGHTVCYTNSLTQRRSSSDKEGGRKYLRTKKSFYQHKSFSLILALFHHVFWFTDLARFCTHGWWRSKNSHIQEPFSCPFSPLWTLDMTSMMIQDNKFSAVAQDALLQGSPYVAWWLYKGEISAAYFLFKTLKGKNTLHESTHQLVISMCVRFLSENNISQDLSSTGWIEQWNELLAVHRNT